MKKGKSVKLNLFTPIKTSYGTVDSKNLKSVFLNIQSWVSPKRTHDNWNRVVSSLSRDLRCTLNDSTSNDIFLNQYIVDLDLRTSGLMLGKKSFFNLEITLFTKTELDFRDSYIKETIKKIIRDIYRENILNNSYFEFYASKNESSVKV